MTPSNNILELIHSVINLAEDLSSEFSRDLLRDFSRDLLRDFSRDLLRDPSCAFSRDLLPLSRLLQKFK